MSRSKLVPRRVTLVALVLLIALSGLAAGCDRAPRPSRLAAPAESVQQLLRLRSENSTDAAQYKRHVESTSLAETLARDSAERKQQKSPIPAWAEPQVSRQESSTAEVLVEWKLNEEFEGWPEATLFTLRRAGQRWLVVDAVDSSATAR